MPKLAKPFREGRTWSMRRRLQGRDLYVSGHATSREAAQAMDVLVARLDVPGRPKGDGPAHTTLAYALQDYALERLPFLKGGVQEVRIINRYLRLAGIEVVQVTRLPKPRVSDGAGMRTVYCVAERGQVEVERRIPKGLGAHRNQQAQRNARVDQLRRALANKVVADIQAYDIQELVHALQAAGSAASTIHNERATLRRLFNYARQVWRWTTLASNPATGLSMPKVDNARDRTLTLDEQARVELALAKCRRKAMLPAIRLYVATAMRASEPIMHATWGDVDWVRRVLMLSDSKNGKRPVPLAPDAMAALQSLKALSGGHVDEPVLPLTYDKLSSAWRRACQTAGVSGVRLHDLRHTAATRASAVMSPHDLKRLTGHKTWEQLDRYVNVSAADVAARMHASAASAAVPMAAPTTDSAGASERAVSSDAKVVVVDFAQRRRVA